MADQPANASIAATSATLVTYDVSQNRRRLLQFMRNTHDSLLHVLAAVSQETATTLRDAHDGDQGWTVLEVLCHLRDFDNIFRGRAQQMCAQDRPALPFYDHEQLAAEGHYNRQLLTTVKAEFSHSRAQTIAFFEQLNEAQWQRAGIHPERGPFTMLDAALQVGMHDMTHVEQITRILFQNEL